MFAKILFPTDFSSHAQAELACISTLPGISGIVLLHIVKKYPIPFGTGIIEGMVTATMQVYLDEAKRYLETVRPGITVTLEMVTSMDIAGAILDTAIRHDADLIVISGYVKSFTAGVLLSRVPATVLCRISRTNVLLMPNRLIDTLAGETYDKFCRNIFAKILCPTDFSEHSALAVACAGRTPGVQEVLLLHVLQDSGGDETGARGRLAVLRDTLAEEGVRARMLLVRGEPAREIARVADAEDVSLLWMSTSGRGCLAEFLSGSLVHDVVMNGTRPALIVREGA